MSWWRQSEQFSTINLSNCSWWQSRPIAPRPSRCWAPCQHRNPESVCSQSNTPTSAAKWPEPFPRSGLPLPFLPMTTWAGHGLSSPGSWPPSKRTRNTAGWSPASDCAGPLRRPSHSASGASWVLCTWNDATSTAARLPMWMADFPACRDGRLRIGHKFCRMRPSPMLSPMRSGGGASTNSTPTMTTLSPVGWSRTDGKLICSTTQRQRCWLLSRTTLVSWSNAPAGQEVIGGAIWLRCFTRSTFGSKCNFSLPLSCLTFASFFSPFLSPLHLVGFLFDRVKKSLGVRPSVWPWRNNETRLKQNAEQS